MDLLPYSTGSHGLVMHAGGALHPTLLPPAYLSARVFCITKQGSTQDRICDRKWWVLRSFSELQYGC